MKNCIGTILSFNDQLVFIPDDPKDHPVPLLKLLSSNLQMYLTGWDGKQMDNCDITIDPDSAVFSFSINYLNANDRKTAKKQFGDLNRYVYETIIDETHTNEVDIFARSYEEAIAMVTLMHNGYIISFINAVAAGKARLFLIIDNKKQLICPGKSIA